MNFSDADINTLPPVPAHLFSLAHALSVRNHHRSAALAYASVARAPGTTRYHQAVALYLAAQHLFISVQTTGDDTIQLDDRLRALGYLQKCKLLARDLPRSLAFVCTMQSLALIERINTYVNNHLGSVKTINDALNSISSGADDPQAQLRWWCYFRAKAVANALASGNSVQQASKLASESAAICSRNNDFFSATAFHLTQVQIALGASVAGINHIRPDVKSAIRCLDQIKTVPSDREMDFLLLDFASQVLQCLSFIRVGDLKSLRELLPDLSKAYNRLRKGRRHYEQNNYESSSWNWWPQHYLTSVTYFVMTAVSRSNCEMQSALIHAMTALSRVGITEENLTTFTLEDITAPGVSPRATLALAVALLDNAARVRLTQVFLNDASALIGAVVDLTFREENARSHIRLAESEALPEGVALSDTILSEYDDVGLIPRCTAFLLLAEYHNLRGRVSAARVATVFLDAVRAIARSSMEPPPSDTWQIVVSHLSLITGEDRRTLASSFPQINDPDGDQASSSSDDLSMLPRNFISAQIEALAWFTNGLHHTRNKDVLESRRALSNCLNIVNRSPFGNEQLIANASAVLSGLIIARENTGDRGMSMATTAVELSQNLGDIVTIVRATRQYKKVLHRMSHSQSDRQRADDLADEASAHFTERIRHGGPIFSSPPS